MYFAFIFVLICVISAFGDEAKSPFSMLQSNQIVGMIPDIDDAYGIALRDFNGDDHPDVYITCFRSLNRLLINNGGLIPFVDRTIYSGTGGYLMTHGNTNLELGVSAADYDNDGLVDIFLAGWGKTNRLLRNSGLVTFDDVTANLSTLGKMDANQGLWLDVNNDGFLDLYVTDEHQSNRLFRNRKNGFFKEVIWTDSFVDNAVSQGASSSDINMDGYSDIYVSNWYIPDYMLINNRSGKFDLLLLDLPTLTDSISTNSSCFADFDNDGDSDIMVAGDNGYIYYYENQSDSTKIKFINHQDHPFYILGVRVFGLLVEDFNQDGWLDCFITTSGENRLYINDKTGNFFKDYDSDKEKIYSTGASAADLDNDGDLDIVVSNKTDNCQVYLNPSNSNNFLKLTFVGVASNRDAIGTKVYFYSTVDSINVFLGYREVTTNTSYLSSKDPEIVYGTGDYSRINIRAVFPSGVEVVKENRKAGRSYKIAEYSGIMYSFYSSLRSIKHLTTLPDFRVNTLLILAIFLFIAAYLYLGLKRYLWSAFNISFQLSLWFLVSLFLFLILKTASTLTILLTILSLAFFSTILLTLYSEHFLRLRRKRDSIRSMLQNLSDQIINIHENSLLAKEVVNTVNRHPAIKNTYFYILEADDLFKLLYSGNGTNSDSLLITKKDQQVFKDNKIISTDSLHFETDLTKSANILLPIKRKELLLGAIALNMPKSTKAINQEDIIQLSSVASQCAVAIENNNYIKETARLIEELTSAKVREQYVQKLEKTNEELDQKNKELNRLFNELREKEAQLIHSEKMASLGHLVAGISHELNNPISFIYSNMKILTEYIDDLNNFLDEIHDQKLKNRINKILAELKSTIEDSSNGSKAIKEIVQDLKNFSRLDQAEWKESKISEIINSCLKILKPQIPETINIEIHHKEDISFLCNPGQLNQVFLNLFTNSIQAIETKGTIKINSEIKNQNIVVSVEDNGPGIPKATIQKIFDPFFTTKPVNKGTGLGLSISYSIIQKHSGELSVRSKPGKGTIFTVKLPLNLERPTKNA